jgi:hypothetical protein
VDAVRAIADAVLYEGYVLWPYRRSALKNTRRWTFGGVYPPAHGVAHPDDPSVMRTECLLEAGGGTEIDVRVRFLQVVRRQAIGAAGKPVDELTVDGRRHLSWSEAGERELSVAAAVGRDVRVPIELDAACEDEPLLDARGRTAGSLRRGWRRLEGQVRVAAVPMRDRLARVTVTISNTTPFAPGDREEALERTFCSTHTVLHAECGEFVSLTDPPDALAGEARACRNEGTWPVLAGERGDRRTILSSPIILEDHPRVAPESPGDLFDGGEIDQLLVLNILALTDEEKDEMRATDPRTREILARTEALTADERMALHGAIRELGMVRRP